jgi:hypothetical protein
LHSYSDRWDANVEFVPGDSWQFSFARLHGKPDIRSQAAAGKRHRF